MPRLSETVQRGFGIARKYRNANNLRHSSSGECIGLDNIRASFHVSTMDLIYHIRPRQRQQIVVPFQILWMVFESIGVPVIISLK